MIWETVMGLEVHAELSTDSKIFCGCSAAFGSEPNTLVCPVCAGLPGVLPRLNENVVEYAVRLGLILDCDITRHCKFDRKNYFYPDLPKAYQTSQLYAPICRNGKLEIETENGKKTIGIREIHMEEDAGKLIHDPLNGNTAMDFNRCGVPLLEIVTNPDFSDAEEVNAYLERLREILLYSGICDCKMQEGSMRADINLSVRERGGELGTRTEMKNLNSFKAITRAIEFEQKRQIEILENGGEVIQETRRWDDNKRQSYGMRSKENAQDYRYFPEPDLLPISISDSMLKQIQEELPELAHEKRARYQEVYGITEREAKLITTHKNISSLFEDLAEKSVLAREAANLVLGEIMRLLNTHDILPENLNVNSNKLSYLINILSQGKINRNSYKEAIQEVFLNDINPEEYIEQKGLLIVNDETAVLSAVNKILENNAQAVSDYKNGKEKAFGFLMGQVMRELRGAGEAEMVRLMLEMRLTVI
ncbi:MAG: Asp-tRNA(Asn)/Glu-tRNA(Gln) amidotransferase subunit GatB [Oscillospiraceae bacterium]|nr:Asp-tRNA(Asn)/Glu-tRNA(Gln) amidotransferase subunit GatB [Oscillospiraceae bacterium]